MRRFLSFLVLLLVTVNRCCCFLGFHLDRGSGSIIDLQWLAQDGVRKEARNAFASRFRFPYFLRLMGRTTGTVSRIFSDHFVRAEEVKVVQE